MRSKNTFSKMRYYSCMAAILLHLSILSHASAYDSNHAVPPPPQQIPLPPQTGPDLHAGLTQPIVITITIGQGILTAAAGGTTSFVLKPEQLSGSGHDGNSAQETSSTSGQTEKQGKAKQASTQKQEQRNQEPSASFDNSTAGAQPSNGMHTGPGQVSKSDQGTQGTSSTGAAHHGSPSHHVNSVTAAQAKGSFPASQRLSPPGHHGQNQGSTQGNQAKGAGERAASGAPPPASQAFPAPVVNSGNQVAAHKGPGPSVPGGQQHTVVAPPPPLLVTNSNAGKAASSLPADKAKTVQPPTNQPSTNVAKPAEQSGHIEPANKLTTIVLGELPFDGLPNMTVPSNLKLSDDKALGQSTKHQPVAANNGNKLIIRQPPRKNNFGANPQAGRGGLGAKVAGGAKRPHGASPPIKIRDATADLSGSNLFVNASSPMPAVIRLTPNKPIVAVVGSIDNAQPIPGNKTDSLLVQVRPLTISSVNKPVASNLICTPDSFGVFRRGIDAATKAVGNYFLRKTHHHHKGTKDIPVPNSPNVLFSPFALLAGLLMAQAGAKGQTRVELRNALTTTNDPALDNGQLYVHLRSCLQVDPSTIVIPGNLLYVNQKFPIRSQYSKVAQNNFRAIIKSRALVGAEIEINDDIANVSHKAVKNLFDGQNQIALSDAILLINTLYFKGPWQFPFDPKTTDHRPFHVTSTHLAKVRMMQLKSEDVPIYELNNDVKILELPYKGENFSLFLLLPQPHRQNNFAANYETLVKASTGIFYRAANVEVRASIPRFDLTSDGYELNEPLTGLGLRSLFENGDLSGMIDSKGVGISSMRHKIALKINEEGTEVPAAAADAVENAGGGQSKKTPTPRIIDFIADRPFYFLLSHKLTRTPLFVGFVRNPIAKQHPANTKL